MSDAELVLRDALLEAGYGRVTPWHLRCLDAYLGALDTTLAGDAAYRLQRELACYGPDALHKEALDMDGRWYRQRTTSARLAMQAVTGRRTRVRRG